MGPNGTGRSRLSFDTPIGTIGLMEEAGKITRLLFEGDRTEQDIPIRETALLLKARGQVLEYFDGKRKKFELPLSTEGTAFQKAVWEALCTIPYGTTCTYGEIASKIGNPKACRAVGLANNRNPIAVMIPCHRVIGADGKLVGYGGGLHIKEYLLKLEQGHR